MTSSRKVRARRRVGDVLAISLDDQGLMAYAVVLPHADFAIFDARKAASPEAALQRPPMFYVAVINGAVTTGRWPVLQVNSASVPRLEAPPTFMQDPFDPEKFQIYDHGAMRPATRSECESLERTAVWDPEHVEDRIRDAYAGRENSWVRSMQIDAILHGPRNS